MAGSLSNSALQGNTQQEKSIHENRLSTCPAGCCGMPRSSAHAPPSPRVHLVALPPFARPNPLAAPRTADPGFRFRSSCTNAGLTLCARHSAHATRRRRRTVTRWQRSRATRYALSLHACCRPLRFFKLLTADGTRVPRVRCACGFGSRGGGVRGLCGDCIFLCVGWRVRAPVRACHVPCGARRGTRTAYVRAFGQTRGM